MDEKLKRYAAVLCALVMGLAAGLTINLSGVRRQEAALQAQTEKNQAGVEKYQEIMDLVDQYFIASDDVDMTEVNDAMASGIISGLGDRWSYYVSASDYQSYVSNINNAYVGVGITITAKNDDDGQLIGYEVTELGDGGSAQEAGVLPGDVLIKVDGEKVADISLSEVKAKVQGEEGTTVELTFLRDGEEKTFTVERRALTVVPAKGQLLEGSVGYIKITNFDGGCADAVIDLIKELQDQGATSLLFDVRNNPGGLKTELTKLLDYLLPEGTIFHTINYAGEEEIVTSDKDCVDLPMAVLCNGDSYSAAEYFACALQQYGVGKVVGEKTCGKGYYQVGLQLSDGSCLNLSIGKYFTPNGESLIDVGVTPDVELTLEDDLRQQLALGKLEPENDPQIQAALGCLLP